MPNPFSTYYGSTFHGIKVDWNYDAAAAKIKADMTVNFFSEIQEMGASADYAIDTTPGSPVVDVFTFGTIFEILDTSDCNTIVCWDGMKATLDVAWTGPATADDYYVPTYSAAASAPFVDMKPTSITAYEADDTTDHATFVTPTGDVCT